MKNMLRKAALAAGAVAAAAALAIGGAAPAQAVANTFTTNCGAQNPKILVSAPSYVYTAIKSGAVTIASGYGNWNRQLSYDGTFTIVRANGTSWVDVVCH